MSESTILYGKLPKKIVLISTNYIELYFPLTLFILILLVKSPPSNRMWPLQHRFSLSHHPLSVQSSNIFFFSIFFWRSRSRLRGLLTREIPSKCGTLVKWGFAGYSHRCRRLVGTVRNVSHNLRFVRHGGIQWRPPATLRLGLITNTCRFLNHLETLTYLYKISRLKQIHSSLAAYSYNGA